MEAVHRRDRQHEHERGLVSKTSKANETSEKSETGRVSKTSKTNESSEKS